MKHKKKNLKKTTGILLTVIFFLLSLRSVFYLISQYQSSIWDGKLNLAIAFKGKDYLFVYLNKYQKKMYVVRVPKNTLVRYRDNTSLYMLNSLYELGGIEKQQKSVFMESFRELFGYPVQGFYQNDRIGLENFDIKLRDIMTAKSNLSLFDYFKIKMNDQEIIKIDLGKEITNHHDSLKQEVRIFFDRTDIDKYFNSKFEDIDTANLKYEIQIKTLINSRKLETIKRIINNFGWKVSDVDILSGTSNLKNEDLCVAKNLNNMNQAIQKTFSCKIEIDPRIYYDLIIYLAS